MSRRPAIEPLTAASAARRGWLRTTAAASLLGWASPGSAAGAPVDVPTGATTRAATDLPFTFGFIGDTPYSGLDTLALRNVMAAMADEALAFVLHAGDIKSSGDACSDGLLGDRLESLDRCAHPLILTPGDNEWTDCGTPRLPSAAGGPLERLDWLRRQVYARPRTLGAQRLAVQAQGTLASADAETPRLPENLRWRVGAVQFCTLHVVGSNNGQQRMPALARAWSLRQQANGRWLADTVALAQAGGARALVVAMHANPRFERDRADGWQMMRQLLAAAAATFRGPLLLLHGDTHWFRSDRPLAASHGLASLQRVECFGSPFTSTWVAIRWQPDAAAFEVTLRRT